MKEHRISLAEAQKMLKSLPEHFSAECPTIILTRNNRPVLSVMPYETHQALLADIESLQTVLKIMSGRGLSEMTPTRQRPLTSLSTGTSWEDFQKEFGWE